MLSANEFTVGTLADAEPFSLMLPRTRYEATFLIGRTDRGPAAIFIGGEHNFRCFECADTTNWSGLLIPNVRIEVDEKSLFDPQQVFEHLGTIVRTDTRLVILAKSDRSYGSHSQIVLETELPPTHGLSAAFSKWHIVIGQGRNRRVLREIDTEQNTRQSSKSVSGA
jgi:hypothetical protein